jgi:hypothetical protein
MTEGAPVQLLIGYTRQTSLHHVQMQVDRDFHRPC